MEHARARGGGSHLGMGVQDDGPMQVEERQRTSYLVCLTLRRSSNDEVDLLKVQELFHCLQHFPGRDSYELVIEHEEWTTRLVPENNHVHYTREVHTRLEAILGQGMVKAARNDERQELEA